MMKTMTCIKLTLAFFLIVGNLGSAHSQQETLFSKERTLVELDEKIDALEDKQDLLRQVLALLPPSEKIVSSLDFDKEIFPEIDNVEKKIKEYLEEDKRKPIISETEKEELSAEKRKEYEAQHRKQANMWSLLRDSILALASSSRSQLESFDALEQRAPINERVNAEFRRIQFAYGDSRKGTLDNFYKARIELDDSIREPKMEKLEKLVSTTLPKMRQDLIMVKSKLTQEVRSIKSGVESELSTIGTKLKPLIEKQKALEDEIGRTREGQLKIDKTILTFTLPVFAAALVAILLGPYVYKSDTQKEIFKSNVVLEMATVFLLTSTILILGIAEKVTGEVLGTLIAGISGYVLGRWKRRNEEESETNNA